MVGYGEAIGEYRILALSGGGARGILQAAFLARLENEIGALRNHVDMIAATSTGALVGLGVAAGIEARELADLYRVHGTEIFKSRTFALVRRGARYDVRPLRQLLMSYFGDMRLSDLSVEVLICASALNRYRGRIFTRGDRDVSVVDAALASAAAPTYFDPVVPAGSQRGYVDGGLWANDPLLVAAGYARSQLQIPEGALEILSVGTGRVPKGCTPAEVAAMRTASLDTIRFLLDISGSLQEWAARELASWLAPSAQVRRVNPELTDWVELDDARRALELLPGIAEGEYEVEGPALAEWLAGPRRQPPPTVAPLHPHLEAGIRTAGISRVIPARRYYAQYREGRESIGAYVSLARHTLTMISINLASGHELERITEIFTAMLDRDAPVHIRVSLLDYREPALMEAIASALDGQPVATGSRIATTMESLLKFRRELDEHQQGLMELYLHRSIPSASAILLDANRPSGRIQLETKPYRAPPTESWALEVEAGSEFFETLRKAYHALIEDGAEIRIDGSITA